MKKLDPNLFPVIKTPGFNSYSLSCPSNLKRQPVILTEEEMKYIEKNHPDSYHGSVKYGTGKDKFYYICPRYWCFLNNTSLAFKYDFIVRW